MTDPDNTVVIVEFTDPSQPPREFTNCTIHAHGKFLEIRGELERQSWPWSKIACFRIEDRGKGSEAQPNEQ